jgi:hypothetical protein
MPAGGLERRFGFRLATEYQVENALEVREMGKRPQPWIALQGGGSEEPLGYQVADGP